MDNLHHIIESLLFAADEPLTVDRLKNILETVEAKEIRDALTALVEQYEARGGGFALHEVAGGWQLRSRPAYNQYIKRMLQPPPQRMTKASLETLAIVAYNQPIIRADIEHIRGVDCGGVLRQLLERKLIRVLGRKEIPGRPLIYATTKLFLELFDLKDLKDLPGPKEIEALTAAQEKEMDDSTAAVPDMQLNAVTQADLGAGVLADVSNAQLAITAANRAVLNKAGQTDYPSASSDRIPTRQKPWPHLVSAPSAINHNLPKIATEPTKLPLIDGGLTGSNAPLTASDGLIGK